MWGIVSGLSARFMMMVIGMRMGIDGWAGVALVEECVVIVCFKHCRVNLDGSLLSRSHLHQFGALGVGGGAFSAS